MVCRIILEVCPLILYSKYQKYFLIGIHISLIVNIISYAPLYQYDYMRQLPSKGRTYGNFQMLHVAQLVISLTGLPL